MRLVQAASGGGSARVRARLSRGPRPGPAGGAAAGRVTQRGCVTACVGAPKGCGDCVRPFSSVSAWCDQAALRSQFWPPRQQRSMLAAPKAGMDAEWHEQVMPGWHPPAGCARRLCAPLLCGGARQECNTHGALQAAACFDAPQPHQVANVLQLVLEHCPAASAPKTLCSLLRASQTVRAAPQQADGHCCVHTSAPGLQSLASLARFAANWMPQHAGLVKCLELHAPADSAEEEAVQSIVALALQACCSAAPARPAAAGAPVRPRRAAPAERSTQARNHIPWAAVGAAGDRCPTPVAGAVRGRCAAAVV
jgi:hypothetical protein